MKLKNFTLLLLTAFLYTNIFSQFSITKQNDIGGSDNDYFTCMDVTKDGGLILGGYSSSTISGQKTDTSRGANDYWIIKLDSQHNIQWNKTIGGYSDDYLTSIQQTADDGYILNGYSNSKISGDKTQNKKGFEDYWVVKLNSSGNIEWDKTIGGSSQDYSTSLHQTRDSGFIIGGRSYSDSSGDKTQNSNGFADYWIVKLTKQGDLQWNKTIGAHGDDYLESLNETVDGGYILGGSSNSGHTGDKTESSKGSFDYWVVKIDKKGVIQWDKTIGGNNLDDLRSIQQTIDGGYILGGYSYSDSSGNKSENRKGGYDYWVVKLNGSGEIKWNKTIGGSNDDDLYSVQETRDEGYILGGYSYSDSSGNKTENSKGSSDYWIVKLDKKGTIQWDKTIGGNGSDFMKSIKEYKKNYYVLGGYSYSPVSGDKTKSLRGKSNKPDYWIVYLSYTDTANLVSSSNEINLQNATAVKNLNVYPNPVKDILYVQSKSKINFTLTDQSGTIILAKTIEGNAEISVADLTPGVYYLRNNDTGLSQKVVVAR